MRMHLVRNLALLTTVSVTVLGPIPQTRAQTAAVSKRVLELEQRLIVLGERITNLSKNLKDWEAFINFYSILVEQMRDYRQSVLAFETHCFDRERNYERMQSEKSPFLQLAWPQVQRCRSDIPILYNEIKKFDKSIDELEIEMRIFQRHFDLIKNTIPDLYTEQKIYRDSINLRKAMIRMSDQIKSRSDNK